MPDNIIPGHDLILVVIAEVGHAGMVIFPGELQPNFFIDANFRIEIFITDQVAAARCNIFWTTVAFRVEQITFAGLIQVWCFKGSGNPRFDFEVIPQFLREVQAGAEVTAGIVEIIKAQAGNDIRAGNRLNIIFNIQRTDLGMVFTAAIRSRARNAADITVIHGQAGRGRIVELIAAPLRTHGQRLIDQRIQRNIKLAAGSPGAQAIGRELFIRRNTPFTAAG